MGDSKTLVTIATELKEVEKELVENEGLLNEKLESELDSVNSALVEKVDGYSYRLDNLESKISLWKKREAAAKNVRLAIEKHFKSLKDRIETVMISLDRKELLGDESRFFLKRSTGKLVIHDQKKLPGKYKITTVVTSPDNKKIKDDLKKGIDVPGCSIEGGFNLTRSENNSWKD